MNTKKLNEKNILRGGDTAYNPDCTHHPKRICYALQISVCEILLF